MITKVPSEEVRHSPESEKILSYGIKSWWINKMFKPVEDFFMAAGLTPNTITIIGLSFTTTAALCFSQGSFFVASVFILIGGCMDFLDGRIARATNQSSLAGAFFDSVLDRYADALLFLGLLIYYRHSWIGTITVLGMLGALMVSYTKARAEALNIECKVGVMQRPERIFYLGIGSFLSAILTITLLPFQKNPYAGGPPQYILILVILWVSILTNYTAFQRIKHVMTKLREIDDKN